MIQVWADEEALTLRMEGHARGERNPQGHDLVCCAASMLAQALLESCRVCPDVRAEGEASPGHVSLRLEAAKGRRAEAAVRLRMTLDGLRLLAQAYPASVRVHDGLGRPSPEAHTIKGSLVQRELAERSED